ncbi:M28 family metallopeptidase [Fulvivirga sedimenti]|uniref:M28 family metallopeptidase n=1 Tax=Fulvivirga sedimenti TaxID=2879465 RepID=A0A9X1HL73_9BACT|nr:M28 family metallopeptidase [Fulvivirga sedimenti]MCA6073346.1 M28 family metallopeptidase [Fulvivirga sedimenti]
MRYILILFCLLSASMSFSQEKVTVEKTQILERMLSEINSDSIRSYVETLVSFGTRHSLSETESNIRGIGAARRWVLSKFQEFSAASGSRLNSELDSFTVPAGRRIPYEVEMKNVMATLPGSDPGDDRVLIISGHLDSRVSDVMDSTSNAPGANDDASGVALVLELARIMSKQTFPATIIFVAVAGEEQGLLGATHLADQLKKDSINVIAMFNNDMVGNSVSSETDIRDARRMRLFSETIPAYETDQMSRMRSYTGAENDSKSRQLARFIKIVGETYQPDFEVTLNYRVDRYLRGGDHIPFTRNGFTAVRFCEMNENYLHQHQDVRVENEIQYGDLPEYVNYNYVASIARVNLSALATLASAPYEPENVGIRLELGNISTLQWDAPDKGSKPAGYRILIRETYESNWTTSLYTEETSIEIPYSKDNYFFAVQAVNAEGYTSLPVIPVPRR